MTRRLGLLLPMLLCLRAVGASSEGLRQSLGEQMLEQLLVEMSGYGFDAVPPDLSQVADRNYGMWLHCVTDAYRPPAGTELKAHVDGGRSMDVLATAYDVGPHHVRLIQTQWIVVLCVDNGSEKMDTTEATLEFVSGIARAAFTEGQRANLVPYESGDGRLRGRQGPRPPEMRSEPWNWFDVLSWYVRDQEVWLAFLKTWPNPSSPPRVDAKGNYNWLRCAGGGLRRRGGCVAPCRGLWALEDGRDSRG